MLPVGRDEAHKSPLCTPWIKVDMRRAEDSLLCLSGDRGPRPARGAERDSNEYCAIGAGKARLPRAWGGTEVDSNERTLSKSSGDTLSDTNDSPAVDRAPSSTSWYLGFEMLLLRVPLRR